MDQMKIYTYENRMKGPFYEDHTGFFFYFLFETKYFEKMSNRVPLFW